MTEASTVAEVEVREVRTPAELEEALEIRRQVFVIGQDCPPEEEFDEFEELARQFVARVQGQPAATARWRRVETADGAAAKLERFAVLKEFRGHGLGRRMVEHLIADARRLGHRRMVLHAQSHLAGLYGSYGFEPQGEEFEEAGIPHLKMVLAG
ncbi:MAG: GNAT family N-acetyltransferase [Acidobacteriota bacterium]